MNVSRVRLLPLALLLAFVAPAPAADTQAPTTGDPKTGAEVLELPKIQITSQRAKEIDKEIHRLDKLIIRERKKVKATDLDKVLNNEKVARAAAIFGGNSSDHLSAVAASRVTILEAERDILEAMKRPATLDELAMMEKQIEELRITRRNLDDASKQR